MVVEDLVLLADVQLSEVKPLLPHLFVSQEDGHGGVGPIRDELVALTLRSLTGDGMACLFEFEFPQLIESRLLSSFELTLEAFFYRAVTSLGCVIAEQLMLQAFVLIGPSVSCCVDGKSDLVGVVVGDDDRSLGMDRLNSLGATFQSAGLGNLLNHRVLRSWAEARSGRLEVLVWRLLSVVALPSESLTTYLLHLDRRAGLFRDELVKNGRRDRRDGIHSRLAQGRLMLIAELASLLLSWKYKLLLCIVGVLFHIFVGLLDVQLTRLGTDRRSKSWNTINFELIGLDLYVPLLSTLILIQVGGQVHILYLGISSR